MLTAPSLGQPDISTTARTVFSLARGRVAEPRSLELNCRCRRVDDVDAAVEGTVDDAYAAGGVILDLPAAEVAPFNREVGSSGRVTRR